MSLSVYHWGASFSIWRTISRSQQQIYRSQKKRLRKSAGKHGNVGFREPTADPIFSAFSICISGSTQPPVYCSPDASKVKPENSIVPSIFGRISLARPRSLATAAVPAPAACPHPGHSSFLLRTYGFLLSELLQMNNSRVRFSCTASSSQRYPYGIFAKGLIFWVPGRT